MGSEVPVTLGGRLVRAECSGASTSLLWTRGAHFSRAQPTSSRSLDCRSLSRWPRLPISSSGVMSDVDGAPLAPCLLRWGPAGVGWGCTVIAKDSGQSESFAGVCHDEDHQRPCAFSVSGCRGLANSLLSSLTLLCETRLKLQLFHKWLNSYAR